MKDNNVIRASIRKSIEDWAPERTLAEEGLEEVFNVLDKIKHKEASRTRKLAGKGGPLHEQAIDVVIHTSILLCASEEMNHKPDVFHVFWTEFMNVAPAPTHPALKLIQSAVYFIDRSSSEPSKLKDEYFEKLLG